MTIGPVARRWFLLNFGDNKNKTHTSKYYLPEESWPKTHVWWVQSPLAAINKARNKRLGLLVDENPIAP